MIHRRPVSPLGPQGTDVDENGRNRSGGPFGGPSGGQSGFGTILGWLLAALLGLGGSASAGRTGRLESSVRIMIVTHILRYTERILTK